VCRIPGSAAATAGAEARCSIDRLPFASRDLGQRRYTEDELLALAADHDPGFDRPWFAEALSAIDRLPDRLFQAYDLSAEDTSALKVRMRAWADRIRASR
jgi:hypothetical protein